MKALIISMGSIGTRHAEVLTSMGIEISAITSQNIRSLECFNDLKNVNLDKFDYFIIASPTHLHYEHLSYIDTNVSGKIILCEKPLFDKFRDFNPNNKIFIGYNLRFHPLILELKNMLNPSEILTIEARCGQYLPSWRKRKYTSSYSAKKELGGGVLLDLSHEIDYLSFLCDSKLELIKSCQTKVSNLNITSDDICMILAKCNKTLINISLNYLSKTPYRQILIETNNNTYHLDLITNRLKIVDQDGKITQIQKPNLQRNDTFKAMHMDALNMQNHICTFSQAMDTMRLIDQIQKENI
ncbi:MULTISPECIES: Gfo/Idh/MocA family protein [Campylobacter]|uniref:Gfo/Idh/MocA family oxidoreductase n=1 Tax=Campylobacter vicugnae TaxID=1660076 RepID=A0ABZ2E8L3_9BACT|nr:MULTISPECIES: Gfo/Idh/MocA family oxidoreductase [unclassified Campylobacter]MCR8690331.1 Gfo/Idh/MocA family oxidoreductase [Campylobacter sp. RM9264]MCR8701190.1 Gfo/Idh/MocA family oxidoreductase [Campylobacter sp. RM12176]